MSLFFEKAVTSQDGLLILFGKETHSETKTLEIVEDFDERNYNNNGKPWKSSRILRAKPNFFIFSLFIIFLHFSFSHFFMFRSSHFPFFPFSFFFLFFFLFFSFFLFVLFFFLLFLFLFSVT